MNGEDTQLPNSGASRERGKGIGWDGRMGVGEVSNGSVMFHLFFNSLCYINIIKRLIFVIMFAYEYVCITSLDSNVIQSNFKPVLILCCFP